MVDRDAIRALRAGTRAWHQFREAQPRKARPDLRGANLRDTDLTGADLTDLRLSKADLRNSTLVTARLVGADLRNANLMGADLTEADLGVANLVSANLRQVELYRGRTVGADLNRADLTDAMCAGTDFSAASMRAAKLVRTNLAETRLLSATLDDADMTQADLAGADLENASLVRADLTGATLESAQLARADLSGAILVGCSVYAASVWDTKLDGAEQRDLLVTPGHQEGASLLSDDLEVAQFLYLLIKNKKIRNVIDSVATRTVLILGRFTIKRKRVLDAIGRALRAAGWIPVVFDFEGPRTRDITETVSTLAHVSRFIIADITDPRSIPQELTRVIPLLPSVVVRPIIQVGHQPWAMFKDLERYPWVLPPYAYRSAAELIKRLERDVIRPAKERAEQLRLLTGTLAERTAAVRTATKRTSRGRRKRVRAR